MRHTKGENIFNVVNIIIMFALMVLAAYPILYVVLASFSESKAFMQETGLMFKPAGFSLASYKAVFTNPNITRGYLNTIFYLVVGTAGGVFLTVLAGYCLSRKDLMFRNPIMLLITFTMFFGGGLIPTYLNVQNLGLLNTRAAVILPTIINTFNLIIMRTAFTAVPDSLAESASLDGAGHFTILFKIMIPLVMPTIMVIVLYYAVERWNEWFNAMIYLQDSSKYPLALVLREILMQNDTSSMTQGASFGDLDSVSETIKYAVIVVATLPILVLYPFLQKYFVKGVMVGAVKG
ncbi:MAG: carbohydrate ABC transporter permease [Clostridiales bacterium]|nr:carbohydrate ABC transporter permease [Clostridiales bacterium]